MVAPSVPVAVAPLTPAQEGSGAEEQRSEQSSSSHVTGTESSASGAGHEGRRLPISEESFRRAMEASIPSGIAAVDTEGRQIYVNAALCEMLGYAEEELVGQAPPFVYWPEQELPAIQEAFRATVEGRAPRSGFELRFRRRDGELIDVHVAIAPLIGDESEVIGYLASVTDITERRRTETRVSASEARVRELADAMPQIVFTAESNGRITFLNKQWFDYTGHPQSGTADRTDMLSVVNPDDLEKLQRLWRDAVLHDAPFSGECRTLGVDGEYRWFLVRAVPIKDDEGRTVEWFGTSTDIQSQKQILEDLEQKKRSLETINDINASLAAELDLEKLVQAVTDAGTDLTGARYGAFFYTVKDPDGERYQLYSLSGARKEDFENFPMPRKTMLFRPIYGGERMVRLDDVTTDARFGSNPPYGGFPKGHLQIRSYLAVPIVARSGERIGGLFFGDPRPGIFDEHHEQVVAAIADQAAIAIENARLYRAVQNELTERKRAQQELRRLNESLERRVMERTKDLEAANVKLKKEIREREKTERQLARMNQDLRRSNRELQDFAHVASHDLQEPLRKISSFADLLRSEHEEDLGEEGVHYLHRIQDAALRMSGLINDLLAFSRIETRGRPFEKVDLCQVARTVLSDLEMLTAEAQGEIVFSDLPSIDADETQMRQLFQNIIGNALKFRRPDVSPRIRISAEVCKHDSATPEHLDVCRITFEDNGIGFEDRYASRIFAPFQRLHTKTDYPGTGIGLAICRRIVERHRGEIQAFGRPGEGATFVITLPLRQRRVRQTDDRS